MSRPYDPDLDYLHVQRNGTILLEGEPIGFVMKTEGTLAQEIGAWRAELGDVAKPTAWPPYRAGYAKTRRGAVAVVMDGLEVPDA